jgi:hypothetical protein
MKKARVLMLGLALGLASTQAHALVDVSGFGGYATVSMKDVNSAMDNAGGTDTHISSGYYVGADAGITLLPFLKVGPRIEYLQPQEGSVTAIFGNATIDTKLMMYDLGVSVDTGLPLTGLSIQGGIWGGYGVSTEVIHQGSISADGAGTAFVGEIAAQLRYKLGAGLSVGVDLGYLMANVTTVNGANGQALITNNGSAVGFDFSGLHAGGALSWGF